MSATRQRPPSAAALRVLHADAARTPDPFIRYSDGRLRPVLANAIAMLTTADEWRGVLAHDEFKMRTVTRKPSPWGTAAGNWTDIDDLRTAEWLQHHGVLVSPDVASQAAEAVARETTYHPVREYLESLNWDRRPRLDAWPAFYLGVELTCYTGAVGSRFMISAVARIFQPGAKADCVPIVEGPQGIGKSRAVRALFGPWVTDDLPDLTEPKDSALATLGVWCIEMSELDSLTPAESARIKAFVSRATDRFRPPYARRLIESPRQCVFVGTTNYSTYLRDETGARRFWPITAGKIDLAALDRDRDQLWAEALTRYRAGEAWWLDTEELTEEATEEQRDRYSADPWQEPIERYLLGIGDSVATADILRDGLRLVESQWTRAEAMRVGSCLRLLGWTRFKVRDGSRVVWRYRRPDAEVTL
ncbi:MAG: VapE domain-containing protein [Bryobacteraceae bacterium]